MRPPQPPRPGVPRGIDPRLPQALKLHQSGRLKEALAIYGQIIASNPRAINALTYGGAAFLDLGQIADAVRLLSSAVKVKPDHVEALTLLGNAQQMAGRPDAAEKHYSRALDIQPGNAQAQNNLGALLQRMGRDAEAAERFREAVKLQPAYAQALNNLAQALLKLGETEEAVDAAHRAAEAAPEAAEVHNTHGTALSEAGRIGEAVSAFRKATELKPDFLDAFNNLSVALLIEGQAGDAVSSTARALELDPTNVPALASRAVALTESGDEQAQAKLVDFNAYLRPEILDPGASFPDLAAMNDALVAHIYEHPTLVYEREGNTTRKGRHTGNLLAEDDTKGPFAAFELLIDDAVARYRETLPDDPSHPMVATAPDSWRLSMWSVVMEQSGHQLPHIHEDGWLSGVYYPRLPSDLGTSLEDPVGWIEFGQPQSIYNSRRAAPVKMIRPEVGMLVLFPSYFYHRTVPTRGTERRVSIAFDVVRTGGRAAS